MAVEPIQRLWRKSLTPTILYRIDPDTNCWVWLKAKNNHGYGHFYVQQQHFYAHRWMYERVKGKIPDGLVLDHIESCRNPSCINPEHLEPVTQQVNVLRGISPTAKSVKTGFCKKGLHKLEGKNIQRNGPYRLCRVCRQEYEKRKNSP